MSGLKIVTWNINGIRSGQENLKDVFDSLGADIIALQETKITRYMLDEPTALVDGYNSYYSFCRKKSGYSGVATYCRNSVTPYLAEEGIAGTFNTLNDRIEHYSNIHKSFTDDQLKELDAEGRCVMTLHKFKEGEDVISLVVINVYCPHACENEERLAFKLLFYRALELRCRDMIEQGFRVIVLGDINVSHRLIDHCEPDDVENFSKSPSRIWLDGFIAGRGEDKFVDSFRHLYPTKEKSFTCWMTQINARVNNYGTRIDYIFLSSKLVSALQDSLIMADVHGSDHCPVKSILLLDMISSTKAPALCTKNFKEFAGKQLKMSSFVCKRSLEEADKNLASQNKKLRVTAVKTKQQSSLLKFFGQPRTNNLDRAVVETTVLTKEELLEVTEADFKQSSTSSSLSASLWKNVLKGAPPPPLCKGHQEVCVLRTVKKKGPNMNRQFWACSKAVGHSSDPNAQCNFFQWVIGNK